jgi:hypothetical protein
MVAGGIGEGKDPRMGGEKDGLLQQQQDREAHPNRTNPWTMKVLKVP